MNIDVLSKSQISTDDRKCCIIHRRFSRVFIDDKSILDTMGLFAEYFVCCEPSRNFIEFIFFFSSLIVVHTDTPRRERKIVVSLQLESKYETSTEREKFDTRSSYLIKKTPLPSLYFVRNFFSKYFNTIILQNGTGKIRLRNSDNFIFHSIQGYEKALPRQCANDTKCSTHLVG